MAGIAIDDLFWVIDRGPAGNKKAASRVARMVKAKEMQLRARAEKVTPQEKQRFVTERLLVMAGVQIPAGDGEHDFNLATKQCSLCGMTQRDFLFTGRCCSFHDLPF